MKISNSYYMTTNKYIKYLKNFMFKRRKAIDKNVTIDKTESIANKEKTVNTKVSNNKAKK